MTSCAPFGLHAGDQMFLIIIFVMIFCWAARLRWWLCENDENIDPWWSWWHELRLQERHFAPMAKFWNRVTPTQLHAASLYHWWIPRCKVWWLSKSSVLSHQITPFLFRRKDLPRRHWQIHMIQFFNRCEPISGRTLQRCLVFLDGEPPLLSTSSGNLSLMASRLFCYLGSLTRSTTNIPSLILLRPR